MSQADELTRVKARIKALADKTVSNGCTEAEAMSAAEMVGRLLERYALTMGEIDVRAALCVQVEVPTGAQRRRPIDGCVTAIARFCDCKVWLKRNELDASYIFFGFDTDTSMATYLFAVIARAITTELSGFRRANPKLRATHLRTACTSFQHGMALRIAERLETMHTAREAAVSAQRETGTALIVVKHRVVEDAFREQKIRLVSNNVRNPIRMNAAFHQGQQAGDRANLNAPVTGGGTADRRLAG